MTTHAKLSPSGAHRWMTCAGSLFLESKIEDRSSSYADEGTAAHSVATWMLKGNIDITPGQPLLPAHIKADLQDDENVQKYLDLPMIGYVKDYCKIVREYAGPAPLLVEQRVDFSEAIGVGNSFGTSDVVIPRGDQLIVIDLKYGMGVQVDAFENEQLMLYGLGALHTFDYLGDFEEVVLVISQPRIGEKPSEWVVSVADLRVFAEKARAAAIEALAQFDLPDDVQPKLQAGESQCRFCRAKATCPALRSEVLATVTAADASDFDEITEIVTPEDEMQLAAAMDKVGLIEDFCKAIRAEVERRLTAGSEVPGYKLIEGRKGNRAWVDEDAVEEQLKKWRLKQEVIYDFDLKSPTQAEKVLPPNRWKALQGMITRSAGKPSVAPATHKSPAISLSATADEFC